MYLCTKANETYITISSNVDKIIAIKNKKELVGSIGRLLDKILPRKHLRKCNLIGTTNLGEKLENGTYTGNLGLLQSRKGIIYIKSEPQLFYESWINYNIPFTTERYLIDMEISDGIKNKEINEMINNLNFGFIFTVCFLLTIFGSYLMTIMIRSFNRRNQDNFSRKFKQILLNESILNQWDTITSSSSSLGLFLLFFGFFIWFLKLNVLNNIKTNKVVVDTSFLIKNEEDAFNTKRVCCFLEGSTELALAKMSPKENILRRIYEEKSWMKKSIKNLKNKIKKNRCIIETTAVNIGLNPKGLFVLFSETTLTVFAAILGSTRPGNIIWNPSKPLFETNSHVIVRNEKNIVERFYTILLAYTEAGIPVELKKSFRINATPFYMFNKIYRSLEEYMDDNFKFDVLVLENFRLLFLNYFALCLIIFLIFGLHNLFGKIFQTIMKFLNKFKHARLEDLRE